MIIGKYLNNKILQSSDWRIFYNAEYRAMSARIVRTIADTEVDISVPNGACYIAFLNWPLTGNVKEEAEFEVYCTLPRNEITEALYN